MLLRFDERLRELRESRKLSQYELAKRLEISRSTVNSWEQGISEPSAKHIVDLTRVFNCSSDYLLSLENKDIIDISELSNKDKQYIVDLIQRLKE